MIVNLVPQDINFHRDWLSINKLTDGFSTTKTEQELKENGLYELKTLIITFALGEKFCIPFFSLSDPSGPNALPGQGRYGFQVSH
ncbi:hypothetical protein ASU31_01390 [Pedobacter ginsenosidimutans]|uniref:Uncharacterized protein n=1 Tax=Pedobacter ginsenosidimutans TaxID=687842 RepID=A0A0T5VVT0_9SPHI|nr:hypothetical protein [Pedobacter ginsenosidimutans]KRT17975.1 hypothetical protein ASU31_01390 [Pedobacter ginsenosidimutans]